MCFSGPSASSTTTPVVATPSDPTIVAALNSERLRQSQTAGRSSTILTGNTGLNQTQSTAPKTLLGQ